MEEKALYYRLGAENVKQLVEVFYEKIYQDERLKHLFTTDVNIVKSKQLLFLTQFLGGPDYYTQVHGHPRLRARHLDHTITEEDAVAWLQNMLQAVESLPISEELKEELFDRFPSTAFFMVNTKNPSDENE